MIKVNAYFIANKANMYSAVSAHPERYPNSLWLLADKHKAADVFNKFLESSDKRQTGQTLKGILNSMNKNEFTPQKLESTLAFVEDITSNIRSIVLKKGGM